MKLKTVVAFFFAFLFGAQLFAAKPCDEAERVVVFGDSITCGGGYIGYLQLFTILRNPGSQTVFMNAGIPGDTAGRALPRLGWDVLDRSPSLVCVAFGMNDVGHGNYGANMSDEKMRADRLRSVKVYRENTAKILDALADAGVKAVLATPVPYDEYSSATNPPARINCNEFGLASCAAAVRELAKERKLKVLDLHSPMTEILKKHPGRLQKDRVHPAGEGHFLMAAILFEAMGAQGEWARTAVAASQMPYRYTPKAFPLAQSEIYRAVEEIYPVTERLNREIFSVSGLAEGKWRLLADGKELGVFSAEQLALGVNLAVLATPTQKEAQRLDEKARRLAVVMNHERSFASMRENILKHGGDPAVKESAFAALDRYLEDRAKSKSAYLAYNRSCVAAYKKRFDKRAELAAEAEKLRKELRSAHPASFTLSVVRE